ncbi:MAG TPA: hypothetical protein VFC78_13050 [Tepidisphaeraceae bacterium]|nr:hypothetical protein [Tepidisphaeraceae bacterium]
MSQTFALLVDSYRELNARKLFWITLIISGLIIGAFALVGIKDNDITFAGATWYVYDHDMAVLLYKSVVLSTIAIGVWLSWGAIVLALISTGGIFPDLISSGAIDLYLSKPIGRLRLFLTKYLMGLLFVTLQVGIFAVGCFLIMGLRAHIWQPSLFLMIPIEVLLFSYIFAFCVLWGVWTRSTIAALLLTALVWLMIAAVQRVEPAVLAIQVALEKSAARIDHDLHDVEKQQANLKPSHDLLGWNSTYLREKHKSDVNNLPRVQTNLARARFFHTMLADFEIVIPKTTETNNLLDRTIISDEEVARMSDAGEGRRSRRNEDFLGASRQDVRAAGPEVQQRLRERTPLRIIGTSLVCEAVVLALAAWIFCRRDY